MERPTCRRNLSMKFESLSDPVREKSSKLMNTSRNILKNQKKFIRDSFSSLKTNLIVLTQKFRNCKRGERFENENCWTTPNSSDMSYVKDILGRTPTQLYSPFRIETPHTKTE